MVPQNFQVLAKLGFCSNCSQNFSGCLFACACIFLQVLACLVFSKGSFFADCPLLARLTYYARARKEKRCARMLINARKLARINIKFDLKCKI